jgi:hypothetical protein
LVVNCWITESSRDELIGWVIFLDMRALIYGEVNYPVVWWEIGLLLIIFETFEIGWCCNVW